MAGNSPKIRNLGQYGVLTDPDPFDIPSNALSFGKNIRFRNGKISQSPIFKTILPLDNPNPRFLTSAIENSGLDFVLIGNMDGTVEQYTGGTLVNASPKTYSTTVAEGIWSSCRLADLVYVNRNDRPPWFVSESSVEPNGFTDLSTPTLYTTTKAAWQADWRCNLIRSCGGALVALGMQEGAQQSLTKIRTSAFPIIDTTPASWDDTDPNTSATSNILAEMDGPIVDACPLGQNMLIYSQTQTWIMVPDNTSGLTFDYLQLPFSKGAINANCSVEINSQNYVFGPNDIWVTDGTSETSICDQKVHDFIFNSLNMGLNDRCMVVHNEELKEIIFCYVAADAYTQFPSILSAIPPTPDGCNRAAIFSYVTGTWSFNDLPYVYGVSRANFPPVVGGSSWLTYPGSWANATGPWSTLEDTSKRSVCFLGEAYAPSSLTASMYAFDYLNNGNTNFPAAVSATGTPYFECTGIDLDDVGKQLNQYWQLNWIVPQGRIDPQSTQQLQFSLGASDGYNDTIIYEPYQGYNGNDLYKIDSLLNGRYLSLKFQFLDYHDFTLSGFDIDIQPTGLMR